MTLLSLFKMVNDLQDDVKLVVKTNISIYQKLMKE